MAVRESLPNAVPVELSVTTGMEEIHHSITLLRTKRGRYIANRDECLKQVALPLGIRPLNLAGGSHCDEAVNEGYKLSLLGQENMMERWWRCWVDAISSWRRWWKLTEGKKHGLEGPKSTRRTRTKRTAK